MFYNIKKLTKTPHKNYFMIQRIKYILYTTVDL